MNEPEVAWINQLAHRDAVEAFRRCCGATTWCEQMALARPYSSAEVIAETAESVFDSLKSSDWLEAFACHPKIGDLESLKMKYAGNREWSAEEQAGVTGAEQQTIQRLAAGNNEYEKRFGYLFIVCASGKSAGEMLELLEARLHNTAENELPIAAGEQRKITQLRLAMMSPTDETESQ